MNKRISIIFRIASAFILALATSGLLPASTAQAAPKNDIAIAASSKNQSAKSQNNKSQNQSTQNSGQLSVDTPEQPSKPPVSKTVSTTSQDPSGNNGFIKVNEEVTPDSIPNNDPHVGCSFKIEFYNYDYNPDYTARVSFNLHNPTSGDGYSMNVAGNTNPFIGQDSAGGGNDLDAVETYKLNFKGESHPKQGYHVKLTVNAQGSRDSDVKHKVFWVKPCESQVAGETDNKQTPKTLSTSTSRQAGKGGVLPSTGAGYLGAVLAIIMAGGAYLATKRIQTLRTES